LAEYLVAGHMAMVSFISDDRSSLSIRYGAEGALAEGACKFMNRFSQKSILLDVLFSVVQNCDCDCGRIGELGCRYLFGRAFDHVCHDKNTKRYVVLPELYENIISDGCLFLKVERTDFYCFPIQFDSFLMSLLTVETYSAIIKKWGKSALRIRRSLISVLLFLELEYVPSCQLLLDLFLRGVCCICKNNQKGIDLIIPLLLPTNTKEHYIASEEYISYFIVQVKNRMDNSNLKESAGFKLDPNYCELPLVEEYAAMYINVHPNPKLSKYENAHIFNNNPSSKEDKSQTSVESVGFICTIQNIHSNVDIISGKELDSFFNLMTSRPQMADESKIATKETSIVQYKDNYTQKINYLYPLFSKSKAHKINESSPVVQETTGKRRKRF
jgi:hypothetical protein